MAIDSAREDQARRHQIARSALARVEQGGGGGLTLADLPLPETKRWVIRRKAAIIDAIRGGLLSLEEACSRYNLSPAEILSWQHCIDRFGIAGLRTTWTQVYLGRRPNIKYAMLAERSPAERG